MNLENKKIIGQRRNYNLSVFAALHMFEKSKRISRLYRYDFANGENHRENGIYHLYIYIWRIVHAARLFISYVSASMYTDIAFKSQLKFHWKHDKIKRKFIMSMDISVEIGLSLVCVKYVWDDPAESAVG